MKRLFNVLSLMVFLLLFASPVLADGTQKLMVLPFAINGPQSYQYLEKSVPQMFASRLHWPEHIDALLPESAKLNQVPANESAVRNILQENSLDYVVWGSITVIGEECSLDVRVLDKEGKVWTKSRANRVDQLIPVLSGVSDSINNDVLRREAPVAVVATRPASPVAPVSVRAPETHTEAAAAATGASTGIMMADEEVAASLQVVESENVDRYITQQVNFSAKGMAICDADGDGRLEVFLFDDHYISAFHYENGRLISLGKTLISRTNYNIALNYYDFGPGTGIKLLLTSVDMDHQPVSRMLSYKNRKLVTEVSGLTMYLNVVQQPDGNKIILGQHGDHYEMFRANGIYEMKLVGGKLVQSKPVKLFNRLHIYNFAYLPGQKMQNEPTRVVRISPLEKAQVYSLSGTILFESSDDYSGTSTGIVQNTAVVGLGDNPDAEDEYYYVPMPMPVGDFDGDGRYEIILNKPVTTLGKFVGSYRSFVECEVYCMFWDGLGLSPQWKTPVLNGSIAGVATCDLDGDGVQDLVVCLNTAGATFLHDQKSTIVGFPLKFSKAAAR